MKEKRDEYRRGFKAGVLAAASVASQYDSTTVHRYRLEDCIAMKLNQTRRSCPRRNKRRLEDPAKVMIQGVASALADVHRISKSSSVVCEVAAAHGLTIEQLKQAGVERFDWSELKRAGVAPGRK